MGNEDLEGKDTQMQNLFQSYTDRYYLVSIHSCLIDEIMAFQNFTNYKHQHKITYDKLLSEILLKNKMTNKQLKDSLAGMENESPLNQWKNLGSHDITQKNAFIFDMDANFICVPRVWVDQILKKNLVDSLMNLLIGVQSSNRVFNLSTNRLQKANNLKQTISDPSPFLESLSYQVKNLQTIKFSSIQAGLFLRNKSFASILKYFSFDDTINTIDNRLKQIESCRDEQDLRFSMGILPSEKSKSRHGDPQMLEEYLGKCSVLNNEIFDKGSNFTFKTF